MGQSCVCTHAKSLQSCQTLCKPMDQLGLGKLPFSAASGRGVFLPLLKPAPWAEGWRDILRALNTLSPAHTPLGPFLLHLLSLQKGPGSQEQRPVSYLPAPGPPCLGHFSQG